MIPQEQIRRANYILARASSMSKVKEIYSRAWSDFEKSFKMIEEKRSGEDEWRASLPDTWSFATLKTAQAAFVDSKVVPTIIRHPDDLSSKAEDMRDLYTDVADKGNLDQELYFLRLDAFKLGNGYGKTIYVKDKRWVWDIKKFDPDKDEYVWEKKEINEFDDPKTIRVSPYLILIDDLARADWNTVRDLIEVEVLGRDEAEARYGHLADFTKIPQTTTFLEQLKASATAVVAETDGTGLRGTEFESLQKYHFFAPGFVWSNEVVEILHYWNKGIKTPSGCLDSYEILINGYPAQVDTGKPSPIPYIHKQLPYFHIPYSPYSGDEHYAAGIFEIGRAEAKAIQQHREMSSDRQKISLFSPAFSDVNDEIDQRHMKLKPFAIIRTRGGVPKQFQIPGITNADLALQDRYEASYKRAVGIDERVLGLESTGPRLTATEVSFLREAAMKRLREFSFIYRNVLLNREIRLKLSLFKQYFSSPFKKEPKIKNDRGTRVMASKFKEFKVRLSTNVYVSKEIRPNFFEGEVDVDLALEVLLPMTQAQMSAMWSQILRDAVPFVQAGIIDISLKKVWNKYVESLGASPESLKEDAETASLDMAETEHNLFADKNTSSRMNEVLPNGTQAPYLTQQHIQKHEELLDGDVDIEDSEKDRLLEHMQLDVQNFKLQQANQPQQRVNQITPESISSLGGIGGVSPSSMVVPSPENKIPML